MKKYTLFRKSVLLICAIVWQFSTLSALNYYWVGGSGLWSDHNNHWATTSGGNVFHDQVPQSMDNVFFDANSFPAGGTVTIDPTIIYCMNMDWTGATGTPIFEGPSDKQVWIYGSLTLIPDMTWNIYGEVHFRAFQLGKTIFSAGQTFNSSVFFDGVGGEWTFLDEFTVGNGAGIFLYGGTIRTNNQTVTAGYFYIACGGSPQLAIYLGSSVLNITSSNGFIYICNSGTNLIFDAGTSNIIFQGIGTATLYDYADNLKFYSMSFMSDGVFYGSNTFENLTFSPGHIYRLSGNQTITPSGQLNASGTDCSNFVTIRSQSAGQPVGIIKTIGNMELSYVILQNIAASGGATFSATNSVDLGNNSGWTITPIASRTLYWVGGSGSWNDLTHWSLTSGGSGGECVPTPYDDVFFDANAGLTSGSVVEANNAISYCRDMTWIGITGNPEFTSNNSSNMLYVFGSLTLLSAMNYNYTGQVFFMASTPGKTVFSAGQTFNSSVFFDGVGGEWTFLDEFTVGNGAGIFLYGGTIRTNNQTVTAGYFYIACGGSPQLAIYLGSSVLNITSSNGFIYICNSGTNLIFDAGTSNIIFQGIGTATLYDYADNLKFYSMSFMSDGVFYGSNTFENLTFSPGNTYILSAGSTQTITPLGNFIAEGYGGFPIEIKSANQGQQAILHKDGDPICLDFLYLTDIAATGSAFTYAGANSDDVFNNSGWIFEACPDCFSEPPLPAPALNHPAVIYTQSGQQVNLVLQNLPVGYEAVWFNTDQTTELYAGTANLFQPVIFSTTNFYGAIRDLETGCVSELVQVTVYACPPPTLDGAYDVCQNSAELRWTTHDTPADNCWVVTVGPEGMAVDASGCPQSEQALFTTTVCYINNNVSFSAPVTGMTVVGNQIRITVGSLPANTYLEYYVSETCDGMPAPYNVSSCAGPAGFYTLEAPYTVSATSVKPVCLFISPGYVPNGSFTVTVTDGSTCPGTYTVSAVPIANSGPSNYTPPFTSINTYNNFPAGNFLFANAGVGCYSVTTVKTNSANPQDNTVVIQVCVPDGMDMEQPMFYVTDILGNIHADNDPLTQANSTRNFGNLYTQEGECGRHDEYYVYGFDNCDGFIVANNAVSATASPGTQVAVTPDGFGFYLVEVNWGIGASEVTVTGRDAAGNTIDLILQMNVIDNIAPIVSCFNTSVDFNGESNMSLNVNNLVSASDNCGIQNITLSTNNISCAQIGEVVQVTVTATDYNSNSASCVAQVTVSGRPCGWNSYNGAVGCGSSSAYNPTSLVWSLTGSNCYYTSPYTSDALAFARRSLCGNGSITAQVTSINGTSMGWAGVIMRESNALGAKKAQLMTNLSSLHRRELRVVTNGQAFPQQFASNGRYWLRIVRQGNQFTGYASANGTDWIPVMAQIIAMNACIEIGLVVTNYQQNSTVTATFANVSHTGSGGQALAPPAIPDLLQTAPITVDFSVFPNPTSGTLNLDLTQYIGLPVHIEVYNLQGKLLHFAEVQEVQTAIESLDLSGLHSGMYLVRVTTREFPVVTRRVVVDGKK